MPAAPRFGAEDVGQRISLRRRLVDPPGQGDLVGRLLAMTATEMFLRRNDASICVVKPADVLAGRRVPEHPRAGFLREPHPTVADLARIAAAGWPAREEQDLGPWRLRAHDGVTRRANSVLVADTMPDDLPAALAEVQRWYQQRSLPALVQAPGASNADVELAGRGWVRAEPTLVQTATVGDVLGLCPVPSGPMQVSCSPEPDERWYRVDGDSDPRRRAILTGPSAVCFVTVSGSDGDPWGVGRASVEAGWLGVTSVATVAAARRQGVSFAVLKALLEWGETQRAHSAYLQVRAVSTAARGLYTRLGFTTHHVYSYLASPGTSPSSGG